ncbi:MAG: hypothetical protein VR65_14165 [Desulfobulbaceae bacterium BRH_c16a]|nr:MAG: hypothetical protein VR65_14165 [Desulfobulbaceae bacterium BRH_c16a]
MLAHHFVERIRPGCRIDAAAEKILLGYSWPGNVRELENTLQRALHLCEDLLLLPEHLDLADAVGLHPAPIEGTLREVERQAILSALSTTGANMVKTAKLLGIPGNPLTKSKRLRY